MKSSASYQHKVTIVVKVLLILFTVHYALFPLSVSAKETFGYTEEKPLVIVCDWDFQPFEFLNNDGQPDGFNVDVLNLILNHLNVPHKFVMQEWYLATEMFEKREADLIHALYTYYKDEPYQPTKKYINYYNVKVARRLDMPPLNTLRSLGGNDTLMLKNNDYAALRINEMVDRPFFVEYHSPKDALTGIRSGRYKYFIWGEVPLASKMKELSLDSIALDEIDIPAGELRIIGYNKELVDIIDDEYTRLEQNGELDVIRDKWFHPERVHNDTSPLALVIIVGLLVAGVVIFLLSRLITLRVNTAVRHSADINNMMTTALKMGDYYVVENDLKTGIFRNVYGNLLPEGESTEKDFVSHIAPEQREAVGQYAQSLKDGSSTQFSMQKRWNVGTPEAPQWRIFESITTVENEDGQPRYLLSAMKDITREMEEERENQILWNKYMQLFDTNLVAMSFYDKDGYLIDLNQKMHEVCENSEEVERYFRSVRLFDVPVLKNDFIPTSTDSFHTCQHMRLADLNVDKYVEIRIRPVTNDAGNLVYYVFTSRDITAERTMYLEQRRHSVELNKTNASIHQYEEQLHYLLEQSDMFIWHYDPKTEVIHYTRTPHEKGYAETLDEFFAGVDADEREKAISAAKECVAKGHDFKAIQRYNYTPLESHPVWYSISGVPTYDAQGNLIEYFGVSRNISDLMEAQQKLKEETARAEDSGRLKAAFLANMTHEIRTPLNAIVGFSDILQMVDTLDERMEFIRIIRNNCDMLLRLINDILEASSMGQALAIEPVACDFSQVFDDICQTLEQRVAEAGIPFIKDNPYDTFPAVLDKGRIQQVLTNFTTNAVKYTKTGHIKVGYRSENGGIYFYCEDTGAGIPKEKQAAVFERFVKLNDFVQGTGLGLSICKSIAERCNGRIGVDSEGEGHGSTFWFWIPQ